MQETSEQNLNNIIGIIRSTSVLMLAIHLYYFCFPIFYRYGLWHESIINILRNFNNSCGLFTTMWPTKLFCLFLLLLSCIGNKGKKTENLAWKNIWWRLILGLFLFLACEIIIRIGIAPVYYYIYAVVVVAGFILLLSGGTLASRLLGINLMKDVFNVGNESFEQEKKLMVNENSVNLPTEFFYKNKWNKGWINIVNPFRATMVLGTPGSGKSFAVINQYIKQMINKGYAMYLYDFKFPDLTELTYNHVCLHYDGYEVKPKFYVINFDDPALSHRCNPIHPDFMTDISDAYEAAYITMMNLNKTWVQKQGDFFVESPINLLTAVIWFLKIYENGRYCTFPHAIELLCATYTDVFPILSSYPELINYIKPFQNAMDAGAQDQLQGQIASAQIPLSRIISPALYWVMTGNDFTLDVNNPKEPKILCVGNNPDRQNIYSAALGLYNSRIIKLMNRKKQLKSAVIVDELPTIFFKGLDNLIATARSNKVAVLLGFQDFTQLNRDYGDKESKTIQNTVGNVFSGQVVAETAKGLSERFGKVLQRRESISINRQDTSTSISTQLDSLIPASKISTLSQGIFVGAVTDNFGEEINQKIFNAKIIVNVEEFNAEQKKYKKIPTITSFIDSNGNDKKNDEINKNYYQVKKDIVTIIDSEKERLCLP